MKKGLFFVALMIGAMGVKAQVNIQEMYDFNRGHLTTTLEMFKGDKWGSTFFFNDIYHPFDMNVPSEYYTEISRAINFWQGTKLAPLSLHVEWNGGNFASNSWLFGVEYFLHSSDYSKRLTFQLMYKEISHIVVHLVDYIPLQFTMVWGVDNLMGVKGLQFSGFLDVWGSGDTWVNPLVDPTDPVETTHWVMLAEPQLWYNIGQHFNCGQLSIGGEVEMSYNFTGGWHATTNFYENKGFNVAPCLGLKWNF